MVNWDFPIEAVHKSGSIMPTHIVEGPDRDGDYWLSDFTGKFPTTKLICWAGSRVDDRDGWTIRNVVPKEVEWGPEIKVEGKRPEWLGDEELVWFFNSLSYNEKRIVSSIAFDNVVTIRLPANHPHYTKPTRTALQQLEKYEGFVKRVAMLNLQAASLTGAPTWNVGKEAAELSAELPEVVDGDLLEAREIAEEAGWAPAVIEISLPVLSAAIKRGRALERGE